MKVKTLVTLPTSLLAITLAVYSCNQRNYDDDYGYEYGRKQSAEQKQSDSAKAKGKQDGKGGVSFSIEKDSLAKFSLDTSKSTYQLKFDAENGDDSNQAGKLEFAKDSEVSNPVTITLKVGLKGFIAMEVTDGVERLSGRSNTITVGTKNEEIIIDLKLTAPTEDPTATADVQVKARVDGDKKQDDSGAIEAPPPFNLIENAEARAIAEKAYAELGKPLATKEHAAKVVQFFCGGCHNPAQGSEKITITDNGQIGLLHPKTQALLQTDISKFALASSMPKRGSAKRAALDEMLLLGIDYRKKVFEVFGSVHTN